MKIEGGKLGSLFPPSKLHKPQNLSNVSPEWDKYSEMTDFQHLNFQIFDKILLSVYMKKKK